MCCILPLFSPAKLGGESDQEEKLAATLDKTFFQLQTFAKMFLSLIHTSYKKLTTILQVTYRLDTPIIQGQTFDFEGIDPSLRDIWHAHNQ